MYIYSISNFFGGLFLLFLFPTGCVHSQFKSTKVFFLKVGGGHTTIIFKKEDSDHENSVDSTVESNKNDDFNDEENIENDILNVSKNEAGLYPCDQCNYEATSLFKLKMHKKMSKDHKEKEHSKLDSEVWLHFTLDPLDTKRGICKYCNASFARKGTRIMACHLNSKHDITTKIREKKKNMTPKNKITPVWEYIDVDPSDEFKVICKICGLRLTRFNGPRHVMNVHNKGKTEYTIQCSYCQETFRDNYNKKIHEIRKHTKKYDHHCEVCGKGFPERNILERHKEAVHNTSEKGDKIKIKNPIRKEPAERVVCPHCGSTFASKVSLKYHIQVVHDDVKFECPHCDYSNGRKSNLDLHIKTKHEGLSFPCPHCNYKATRKCNLKVHIKTTHEGLRFNCPHCDFQVTRKDYLEKHISSAHAALFS